MANFRDRDTRRAIEVDASGGVGFSIVTRRNLKMVYVIGNHGVYELTKGQHTASADRGSRAQRGLTLGGALVVVEGGAR